MSFFVAISATMAALAATTMARRRYAIMQKHASRNLRFPGKEASGSIRLAVSIVAMRAEGVWYTYVDQHDVDEIIDKHLVNGQIVERLRI